MPTIDELCDDLVAEADEVVAMVDGLDDTGWSTPTPAPGWDVRDQVAHLARFDEVATLAIAQPEAFRARRDDERDRHGADIVEAGAASDRRRTGREVLTWFRRARAELVAAARAADPALRVPWYGPDMGLASKLTARLMETWAHAQDVADALGVERTPTARLRHVAFLGVRAIPNSYLANGLPAPDDLRVRVELVAPDGACWSFGPEGAPDRVHGPAVDFCLVVTRRRHPDDTALEIVGPAARQWMTIAQTFAGAPGAGRRAGQFPRA